MWPQIVQLYLVVVSACAYGHQYSQVPEDTSLMLRTSTSKLNNTTPYCYHFTWMGSKFNQWTFKNIRNKTCNQYFKDKKTLCINPMVATCEVQQSAVPGGFGTKNNLDFNFSDKGGRPDIKYILANHTNEATCRLSQDHVCVKYTVYYNDIISYETRYCTQVNIELEGPMQKGCIYEKRGSEMIEVCACKSRPGPDGICNVASNISASQAIVLFLYVLFLNLF